MIDPAFDAALDRYIAALDDRDLVTLGAAIIDNIAFVESNGARLMGREAFLSLHRKMFADGDQRPQRVRRDSRSVAQTGWALIEYGSPQHGWAFLGLTFALVDGRWLVVAGQNTPLPPIEED